MAEENYLNRLKQYRSYLESSANEAMKMIFTAGAATPAYVGRQGAYLDAQSQLERLFPELDSIDNSKDLGMEEK